MKPKMADIHCKIPKNTKLKAQKVFNKLGTTTTDAIRMFLNQVVMQEGFPFEIRVPNEKTVEAIKETEKKSPKRKRYSSSKELFKDLDEDEE